MAFHFVYEIPPAYVPLNARVPMYCEVPRLDEGLLIELEFVVAIETLRLCRGGWSGGAPRAATRLLRALESGGLTPESVALCVAVGGDSLKRALVASDRRR